MGSAPRGFRPLDPNSPTGLYEGEWAPNMLYPNDFPVDQYGVPLSACLLRHNALQETLNRILATLGQLERQKAPFTCPVCEGVGHKPYSFYKRTVSYSSNNVQCRTCEGRGVIFS